jgi:hypothetical protein
MYGDCPEDLKFFPQFIEKLPFSTCNRGRGAVSDGKLEAGDTGMLESWKAIAQ